jgi:hypothetical protein
VPIAAIDELVRARGELVVAFRDRIARVRPPAELDQVPVHLDVGMVPLALGELADAIHERERLGEVPEAVLALQSTFNFGVTIR